MSAGVASVAEHEEVSGHRVEDGVDGHSQVRTAKDGAVGRLAALHQGLAHVSGGSRCCGRACSKALVALPQQSAPLRTPRMPWSAAAPADMEGGTGMLDSSSWVCCGLFPKNSTLPVSKS